MPTGTYLPTPNPAPPNPAAMQAQPLGVTRPRPMGAPPSVLQGTVPDAQGAMRPRPVTPRERLEQILRSIFMPPAPPAGAPPGQRAPSLVEGLLNRANTRSAPTNFEIARGAAAPVNMELPTIQALRARMGGPRESLLARVFGA